MEPHSEHVPFYLSNDHMSPNHYANNFQKTLLCCTTICANVKALVNVRVSIRNFVLRILKHAKSQFLET